MRLRRSLREESKIEGAASRLNYKVASFFTSQIVVSLTKQRGRQENRWTFSSQEHSPRGEIKEKEGISNDGISRIDVRVRTFWKIGKVN